MANVQYRFCPRCGTALPGSVNFCPSCGATIVPARPEPAPEPSSEPAPLETLPAYVPPAERRRTPRPTDATPPDAEENVVHDPMPPVASQSTAADKKHLSIIWISVIIALFALPLLVWLALTRFPLEKKEKTVKRPAQPRVVIEESTTTMEPPPPQPQISIRESEQPPPVLTMTATQTAPETGPHGEISEARATERVSEYVRARNYYNLPAECFALRNLGYRNVGYTVEIYSADCEQRRGSPELLGRWRVDALTEEIFVENSSGRFVRP